MANTRHFRTYVQSAIFLLTLAIGFQFYVHVFQASTGGPISVSRPPGVEGLLPIGALMAWKAFLTTGIWDPVHPAAMVILGFAALISFLFRKSFCGWFCPIGTLSEWLFKAGAGVFGKNYQIPHWFDHLLRSLKYLILVSMMQYMLMEKSIPKKKENLKKENINLFYRG